MGSDGVVIRDLSGVFHGPEFDLERFDLTGNLFPRCLFHSIDEQHSVQMIGFVLDNASEQAINGLVKRFALQIVTLDPDFPRADHVPVEVREAEAALLTLLGAFWLGDDRIDKDKFFSISTSSGLIHDEQTNSEIDLIGGQTNPGSFIHQVKHLGNNLLEPRIDAFDRRGFVSQSRMGIMDDLHNVSSWSRNLFRPPAALGSQTISGYLVYIEILPEKGVPVES